MTPQEREDFLAWESEMVDHARERLREELPVRPEWYTWQTPCPECRLRAAHNARCSRGIV